MCVCACFFPPSIPGKLRQFVLDLHSGKLHREFHHGPDPTDSTPGQVSVSTHNTESLKVGFATSCETLLFLI